MLCMYVPMLDTYHFNQIDKYLFCRLNSDIKYAKSFTTYIHYYSSVLPIPTILYVKTGSEKLL